MTRAIWRLHGCSNTRSLYVFGCKNVRTQMGCLFSL